MIGLFVRCGLAVAAVTAILTLTLVVIASNVLTPDCPTEDSCTVEYTGGEWRIIEVIP
jgi:hypothetical protein